ncbi:MAG TPA: TRAP transporter fused permease subunit [Candidatus Binatia bacterium]|nr:TRAP transporter fused permease subunit [Candidatus Binatia bacterium]
MPAPAPRGPAGGAAASGGPDRWLTPGRAAVWIAGAIAISWSLVQIYAGAIALVEPLKLRVLHVVFALGLASLHVRAGADQTRTGQLGPFAVASLAICAGVAAHVFLDYRRIVTRIPFVDEVSPLDYVFGLALVVLVLEVTRRILGAALTIVTGTFIAYAVLGPFIPGPLGHRGVPLATFVEVNYLTTEGIFGVPTGVSADVVFYFVLFSGLLEASGGGRFFIDLATSAGGRFRGGPAKIAVLASSLLGTINGSAVANVVGSGVFTIPLMKRVGYSPRFAGAVEAVASTGGQIMPPVMGAAAFVMADMMGVPYLSVVKAAVIPALLYYLALLAAVHLVAIRDNLTGIGADEIRQVRRGMWKRVHLLAPLVYLVWQILDGYSPTTAALRAGAAAVVVSWLSRATRMGPRELLIALRSGAERSIAVAVPCAAAGIIIGVIVQTGLGLKITSLLLGLSGGQMLPTLLLAMIVCIILGMGMPTTSAYILTAVLMAPALMNLGVPPMAAHLFVFYFACLSMVTPPVALASYAAAGLSGATVWETGWVAFGMSLPAFIVAYGFAYNQGLIMDAPVGEILLVTATAACGAVSMAGAVVGSLVARTTAVERVLLFAAAPVLIVPEIYTDTAGFLVFAGVIARQLVRTRAARQHMVPSPPGAAPGPP